MKSSSKTARALVLATFSVLLSFTSLSALPQDRDLPVVSNGAMASVEDMGRLQSEIIKISEDAKKSVAFIKTTRTFKGKQYVDPFYDFLRQFGFGGRIPQFNPKQEGLGTGFVIDEDEGYIVTNNHVIDGADKIEITIGTKKFRAKTIGTDPKTDIGLVKIENFKKGDLKELEFSDSDKLKVGSFAIAIGNPFGLSHTVTFGIVSATGREGMNVTEYENFIQTDAAINPGNSGGPLINIDGKVIGMNTAIFSKSGGYMGIGFAVPANMIKSVVAQLKKGGKVVRAQMGVFPQTLTDALKSHLGINKNVEGVLIASVAKGSPAEKAGIRSGDVITNFNNRKVGSVAQLRRAVGFSGFDKKIPVEIIRDGNSKKLTIVLKKDADFQFGATNGSYYSKEFGFSVVKKEEQVVVEKIDNNSLAAMSGLMPGDVIHMVNKRRIRSVTDFAKMTKKSKSILLLIERKGREFYVVINR